MATKLVDLDLLTYYDGKIKNWSEGVYKITEQVTAETGYLKTYVLQANGTNAVDSVKINIPKDYLVKAAEVKTCTTADTPVEGLVPGDKYIDFTINTADTAQGSGTEQHIYIAVKDLVDAYTAGNGITLTGTAFSANTGDGLQINATSKAIEVKTGDGIELDGTTKAVKAKLGTGLEINSTTKAIDLTAQNATSASDANAPAIGGITKADYVSFKGAINSVSAGTETAPTADTTKNETVVTKTHTINTTTVGDNTATPITTTEYYVTYNNATATVGQTAAKAGLMSGTDKDNLDALVTALGTDVTFASDSEIDALFV